MKRDDLEQGDELRPEYKRSDFGELVRGKYVERPALSSPEHTVMVVPRELVPVFQQLIAEHEKKRAGR
ncbi:MAG TPA: hypothetical protein VEW48_19470 [Thermoanaerobaculia bacterium]|nr:hypothetical protein [Thermoanaerobaculia bacterium]